MIDSTDTVCTVGREAILELKFIHTIHFSDVCVCVCVFECMPGTSSKMREWETAHFCASSRAFVQMWSFTR